MTCQSRRKQRSLTPSTALKIRGQTNPFPAHRMFWEQLGATLVTMTPEPSGEGGPEGGGGLGGGRDHDDAWLPYLFQSPCSLS